MLLGAVGAYDWNGTVVMHTATGTVVPGKTQFYDPETEAGYERLAGYLGELTSHVLIFTSGYTECFCNKHRQRNIN